MSEKNKKIFYPLLGLTLGVFIMAVGILSFLEAYKIAPGGITGFAVGIKTLFGIPIYMTNLLVNLPLFILAILVLGKDFGWKTFYATGMLSFFLKTISFRLPSVNILMGAILGGLFLGIGIGTVMSSGGTTGGTDLVAALLRKLFKNIRIANLMRIIDGFVILFVVVIEKDITIAIFSILSMLVLTMTIDFILTKDIYKGFFLDGNIRI